MPQANMLHNARASRAYGKKGKKAYSKEPIRRCKSPSTSSHRSHHGLESEEEEGKEEGLPGEAPATPHVVQCVNLSTVETEAESGQRKAQAGQFHGHQFSGKK